MEVRRPKRRSLQESNQEVMCEPSQQQGRWKGGCREDAPGSLEFSSELGDRLETQAEGRGGIQDDKAYLE